MFYIIPRLEFDKDGIPSIEEWNSFKTKPEAINYIIDLCLENGYTDIRSQYGYHSTIVVDKRHVEKMEDWSCELQDILDDESSPASSDFQQHNTLHRVGQGV